ncbi:hypothetical protein KIW84_025202 [Lathyrus oleraceus]|uniref:Uncharacterized protein n=1 Tax=Pisum sativum TaxID=3888 RepID=A0A9D4YHK7_PEA|nr:hypothetical protein KIW84_025202 [Pisum sativum]
MDNKKWEELYLRASSIVHMYLAKNIFANVLDTSSAKELWEKLEELDQGNEVSSKINYEERRLKSKDNTSSNSVLVARGMLHVKKSNEMSVRYWKCRKIEYIKYKCPNWTVLEKGFELNSNNVSLAVGEDDLL